MGFLQLIPASDLAASYDPKAGHLTLYAKGNAIGYTSGIDFRRDPKFVGGMKFDLYGWVGPLSGKPQPYTYSQAFSVVLPSPIPGFNSKSVIIADANNPNGVEVPIRYMGVGEHTAAGLTSGSAPAMNNQLAATPIPGNQQLTVLFKQPFIIQESASLPKFGEVDIQFDQNFIDLNSAGIHDGNIVWTFNSIQTGNTQIVVTVHGGIAQYIVRKVYDVRIIVLEEIKDTKDNAILSFLGRVNIAVRLVDEQYPHAELYMVEATAKQPTTNPNDTSQLKVVFRAGRVTATIRSTGWGEFGPIEYSPDPIIGNANLPWPINMDITEADALLKAAGYTGTFDKVTLLQPLYPGVNQSYYVFQMSSGENVYIGVNDKKVNSSIPERAKPTKAINSKPMVRN